MRRRGISPVVASVLLLIITVTAAALIMSFVLPFIKGELNDGGSCLEVLEGIEFGESEFNCFDSTIDKTGFSVKINKDEVDGFRISLVDSSGSSIVHSVDSDNKGTVISGLRMVGSAPGGYIDLPDIGGQRSYVATSGAYERAEIAPVLKGGDVCNVADSIDFESCRPGTTL